ncbi:MAG: hypothetical protein LC102_11720 [Ignavibacteriales bacterium]|nr:hypothetical protein [Ignavibacteriales bacterium]
MSDKKEMKLFEPLKLDSLREALQSEMVNWFDQHYYRIGSRFLPSVTTVLGASPKWYLANWRGDVGNAEADRIMKEAQIHGSNVHGFLNHLLNGGSLVFNQETNEKGFINVRDQFEFLHIYKVVQFLNIVKPKILMSEEIIWSDKYEFAGTMDLLMDVEEGEYPVNGAKPIFLEGGVYVADLKTGKSIGNEAFWQTSAYAEALKEHTGLQVAGTMILHTQSGNAKGIEGFGVKVRNSEEVSLDFENFLKVYEVWKIAPNPAKPKIFQMPQTLKLEDNLTIIKERSN